MPDNKSYIQLKPQAKLPLRLRHLAWTIQKQVTPARKSTWVYVVGCHDFVKIGIAWNVAARIAGMQTGCPYKLTLLGAWQSPDAIAEEEALHVHLDQYRVTGEWFKLPKVLMDRLAMKVPPEQLRATLTE